MILGDVDLSRLLPPFRSKHELAINKNFLNTQKKNLILKNLQFGFRADWTFMNLKKCEEPARSKEILAITYNFEEKACFLAATKIEKYTKKLSNIRDSGIASSKDLHKIVGYLVYAAYVILFGRPLISHILHLIDVKNINK